MTIVYETETPAEAYMMLHLLESAGLSGRVEGEHLSGAAGGLPPVGLVKVVVAEPNADEARRVIQEWESSQPKSSLRKTSSSAGVLMAFFVGLALGAISVYLYLDQPNIVDGIDYTGDGNLDEKWVYENGQIRESKVDRNRDGEWDMVTSVDRYGWVESTKMDDNFDGDFEIHVEYVNGNVHRETADLDSDGFNEHIWQFESDVVTTETILDPATRKVRKVSTYRNNKMVEADYDADGDGRLETHYTYDFLGEIESQSQISNDR